ncbi:MAG: Rod shape-determining protein MreD [Cyclobacteriaceae bacterium]
MNSQNIPAIIAYFFVYLAMQVLLVANMVLFNRGFFFIYLVFLLLLPFDMKPIPLMLVGLVTGLTVDLFYDTFGIHAAACVFIMFLRTYWVNTIPPRGGYEISMTPTIRVMGFRWFLTYALPLIFIHNFVLFFIEAGGFHMFGFTITKVVFSAFLTFIAIVIIQYLFYSAKRGL